MWYLFKVTEFWVSLLNGAITNILQTESNCAVKATTCDCVSNIAPQVYASLPVRNPIKNCFYGEKICEIKLVLKKIQNCPWNIYIKLNMHNVWWYHKPFCCSNSSLFELDESWFVLFSKCILLVSFIYPWTCIFKILHTNTCILIHLFALNYRWTRKYCVSR